MAVFARALDRIGREHWRLLWGVPVGRALLVAALGLVLATAAGLALLWPGSVRGGGGGGETAHTEEAKVTSVTASPCREGQCRLVEVKLRSGGDRGRTATVTLSPRDRSPKYAVGQHVRVLRNERQPGFGELPGSTTQLAEFTYSIVDYDRRQPMLWLAVASSPSSWCRRSSTTSRRSWSRWWERWRRCS
jgi:hypothetical protein